MPSINDDLLKKIFFPFFQLLWLPINIINEALFSGQLTVAKVSASIIGTRIITDAKLEDNKFIIKKVLPEGKNEITWEEFQSSSISK